MTPFLTILFSILFGIAATCLALLWVASENNYSAAVLPGQRWKVQGLGIVTIKEVLSGGAYYQKYGNGTNVSYITEHGKLGHCPKIAITRNGILVRQMTNVAFVSDDKLDDDTLRIYNKHGRIVTNENKDTIDAEFCDPEVDIVSNVYPLIARQNKK